MKQWAAVAAVVVIVAAATLAVSSSGLGSDYANAGCALRVQTCDDPAPAIEALAHGHFQRAAELQPPMGPLSVVLRAPFAAAADAVDSRDLVLQYRLGSIPLVALFAGLGAVLALIARRRGAGPLTVALLMAAPFVHPVTRAALDAGHPEELLGAVLVAAAVLAALADRPALAGLLLGLAVANKLWALLAVPIVLAVLWPQSVRRAAVAAVLAAGLLIAPFALGAPDRFGEVAKNLSRLGTQGGTVTPAAIPWRVASPEAFDQPVAVVNGEIRTERVVGYALPLWVVRLCRALQFAVAFAVAWLLVTRRVPPSAALLALAVVLMARCLLDPVTHSYYFAGPVAALAAWEATQRRGVPWLSLALGLALELTTRLSPHIHTDAGFNALVLGWSIPITLLLTWLLIRPLRPVPRMQDPL